MKTLEGKVAVVTGASKGIGAAIARHLAAAGAAVVVNYSSSREGADRTVAEIQKQGGKAVAVQANVARKHDITRLFTEARTAFGRLDILVNNAGVFIFKPVGEITEELFHQQFDLNVLGLLLTSQEAVKYFGPEGGSIINISSIVATLAPPGGAVYNATKGAVNSITRTLAQELAPRKIRVNGVAPGLVETEGTLTAGIAQGDSERRGSYEKQSPSGRIGKPDDIAATVTFLASPQADWVNGETWVVSGGMH